MNFKKIGAISILATMLTGLVSSIGTEAYGYVKLLDGRIVDLEGRAGKVERVQTMELEMLKEVREDIKTILKEMPRR